MLRQSYWMAPLDVHHSIKALHYMITRQEGSVKKGGEETEGFENEVREG